MIESGSKDDQYDVSDYTDWLGTPLMSIAPIDASLRCQVCKEFYNTPMITSCSHTFCSLCIRRCLANDGKCPACRTTEQENKLRSNGAIAGLVEEFLKERRALLSYAQSVKTIMHSPKRAISETGLYEDIVDQPRKKLRSSGRLSARSRDCQKLSISNQDTDGAYSDEDQPDDSLAACPVCNVRMKLESIDSHLNKCLNDHTSEKPTTCTIPPAKSEAVQSSWSAQKPPQQLSRLPQLNYSLVKEAALRRKLQELGISAQGSRQLLERRHAEWITLWNANCDASRPLNKRDLLHELEIWEKTQGGRAPSISGSNLGSQILRKDFDTASWAAKHGQSYQDLILSAQKKLGSKGAVGDFTGRFEKHHEEEDISTNEELPEKSATLVEGAMQVLPIPATSSDGFDNGLVGERSQDVVSTSERTERPQKIAQADL